MPRQSQFRRHQLASRDRLLKRLSALKPIGQASSLILLWTYYDPDRLKHVENEFRKWSIGLLDLPLLPEGRNENRLSELQELRTDSHQFDYFALRWLKTIDHTLKSHITLASQVIGVGYDNHSYSVRPLNNFIAHSAQVAPMSTQGQSISAYTRHTAVVRIGKMSNHPLAKTVEIRKLGAEIGENYASHLEHRMSREKRHFKVMLWPFDFDIQYAGLDKATQGSVSLRTVTNLGDLRLAVQQALQIARAQEVTILIFPELSIPEIILTEELIPILEENGLDSYPMLTVASLCHVEENPGSVRDLNEAVLLGPDGTLIHRHRKLTNYAPLHGGRENLCVGDKIVIHECPVGNLCILICLDLFHSEVLPGLMATHVNALLVPSLSPHTRPHQRAAETLTAKQLASTFVCNHSYAAPFTGTFYHTHTRGTVPKILESFLMFELDRPV